MALRHDAIINELNFKIDKLIKLYISSLEQKKGLEGRRPAIRTRKSEEGEQRIKRRIKKDQSG